MCANFQGKSLFRSNGLTGKWHINENCLLVLSLSFSNTPAPITETGQVHNLHLLFTCQSVAWKKRVVPKTCTRFVLYSLTLHSFELFVFQCCQYWGILRNDEMFDTVGCQQELAISFLSWKGHCPFLSLFVAVAGNPQTAWTKPASPRYTQSLRLFQAGQPTGGHGDCLPFSGSSLHHPQGPLWPHLGHSLARQDHCYQFPHHSLHRFQTTWPTSLWHQVAVWPDSVVCLHLLP